MRALVAALSAQKAGCSKIPVLGTGSSCVASLVQAGCYETLADIEKGDICDMLSDEVLLPELPLLEPESSENSSCLAGVPAA